MLTFAQFSNWHLNYGSHKYVPIGALYIDLGQSRMVLLGGYLVKAVNGTTYQSINTINVGSLLMIMSTQCIIDLM